MLNVIYEDNHIIVVVKPQNIPVQEDVSQDMDLLNQVKSYLKEKYQKPGDAFVGLVHRLDRPTGGIMVFAKTSKAASRLCEQIREKTFKKSYVAIVEGTIREKIGHLEHHLKKNERENKVDVVPMLEEGAKKAELNYKVIDTFEDKLSLVDVSLITGRTHQIRVQFSTIGNPLVSDVKYGAKKTGGNLALWSYKITFVHPTTKKIMKFMSYPPLDDYPWKHFNLEKNIQL